MVKDAYYFSHDANARSDEKIVQLLSVYGYQGYGWFWALIEMLREEPTHKLKMTGKYVWNGIAIALLSDSDSVAKFIDDCVNEFHLFATDESHQYFWSESLLRRIREFEERKQKYASAGKKGAESRWKHGIAITTPSENNGVATENDGSKGKGKGKVNNITKDKYGEFLNVLLTFQEYQKIIIKFGEQEAKERIERLSSGIASKGYKYKSHYATILSWARKDSDIKSPARHEAGKHYGLPGETELERQAREKGITV